MTQLINGTTLRLMSVELCVLAPSAQAMGTGLVEFDQRTSRLEETLVCIFGDRAGPGEDTRRTPQGKVRVRC